MPRDDGYDPRDGGLKPATQLNIYRPFPEPSRIIHYNLCQLSKMVPSKPNEASVQRLFDLTGKVVAVTGALNPHVGSSVTEHD